MFLHKFYFWEKSYSCDIGQNALSQLDCRIFKSIISPEQITSFSACWYKLTKIKSWSKILTMPNMVENGRGQSGLWTLKFIAFQEWTDWINWFFAYWYKFTQIKRWWRIFGVGLVKNGCGQLCDGTIKLTVSEEWTYGISWFFACWYRFTKVKS